MALKGSEVQDWRELFSLHKWTNQIQFQQFTPVLCHMYPPPLFLVQNIEMIKKSDENIERRICWGNMLANSQND